MPDAYISQITLPSGSTYKIKDEWAREQIQNITGGSAIVFKGVSSTALTDGADENPTVNNVVISAKTTGDLYFYGQEEFIYGDDSKWHSLGQPLSTLGTLARKNGVVVNYDKTTSVTSSFAGAAGTVAISVSNNNSGNYTPSGSITGGTFSGSNTSFTGSYTPAGTVSQPTFSGATLSSTAGYTPAGTVSQPTFSGASLSSQGAYTPGGTVSTPTISVKTAGSTTTIKNPTKETVAKTVTAAAPSSSVSNEVTYYSVANENLTLYKIGYTTGDSITTSNVTVKTGDAAYQNSAPTFTGTASTVTVTGTPSGTVSKPSFSGTASTITTKGTPSGTVSKPTFSGTAATITTSGTPSGSVSGIGFSGTKVQISGTMTPAGTVTSTPNNTNTNATVTYN